MPYDERNYTKNGASGKRIGGGPKGKPLPRRNRNLEIIEKLRARGGDEIWLAHQSDPTAGIDASRSSNTSLGKGKKSRPDYFPNYRYASRLLEFLAYDTPQRSALLKAANLPADALEVSAWAGNESVLPETGSALLSVVAGNLRRKAESIEIDELPGEAHGRPLRDPRTSRKRMKIVKGINTRRLSNVLPRDVEWLWEDRIPAGKLTIISGNPGVGKSWLSLDIIARLTTGRAFPDGARPKARLNALYVSAEDADDDTLVPRLLLLGGDPSRVDSLTVVVNDKGREAVLALDEHLREIECWLDENQLVKLVVFDPISAYLGKVDSHKNADVRRVLGALSKLADRTGVAVVGINHLSKGDGQAIYRSIGSMAFVAAARAVWQVSVDPENAARRLFIPVKTNLARTSGLAYRIEKAGVEWEIGAVEMTADEALSPARKSPRGAAKDFLRGALRDGPVPAADLLEKSKEKGLCERTLGYAKEELKVKSIRRGGAWYWTLPNT